MNEETVLFTLEKGKQKESLVQLGKLIEAGAASQGLELDILCRRAQVFLKLVQEENIPAANEEYLRKFEENDCKPFHFRNFKLSKNSPSKKIVWIGATGKEISRIEKIIQAHKNKIKGIQAAAKAEKVGFRIEPGESKGHLYKASNLAPKTKPVD